MVESVDVSSSRKEGGGEGDPHSIQPQPPRWTIRRHDDSRCVVFHWTGMVLASRSAASEPFRSGVSKTCGRCLDGFADLTG